MTTESTHSHSLASSAGMHCTPLALCTSTNYIHPYIPTVILFPNPPCFSFPVSHPPCFSFPVSHPPCSSFPVSLLVTYRLHDLSNTKLQYIYASPTTPPLSLSQWLHHITFSHSLSLHTHLISILQPIPISAHGLLLLLLLLLPTYCYWCCFSCCCV